MSSPTFESLESRALFASTVNLVVQFYGAGGPGGFSEDWLDNIADKAGERTTSTVRKYNAEKGGQALKDTLRSIDRNHNRRIDKAEINALNLRVVGFSLGAIQAINFARDLSRVGDTIKDIRLGGAVPVKALVALDPVPSILTDGASSNVYRFGNYYQQKGGDTTIDVYTQAFNVKVRTITVEDPFDFKGATVDSDARKVSRQIRIDSGTPANTTVKHEVQEGFDGKLKGKNVNHGTVPFYAYDWAIEDLTA